MVDSSGVRVVEPVVKDLGEFSVRRAFPGTGVRMIGPWAFFDHMGPVEFKPGLGINVRPHPHINLATVSYLFEGEILHRDSLGSVQAIGVGDVALMVAGSGITHSERESEARQATLRRTHGLQLWVALPEGDEEIDPEFLYYEAAEIPRAVVEGAGGNVSVRVLIGSAFGVSSPVKMFAETLYVEAELKAGEFLNAAFGVEELGLYVVRGVVVVDGVEVREFNLALLNGVASIEVVASSDAQVAFVGGENVGKRYLWWNFLSSSEARIEQAKADWKAGRFGVVPGDEVEFIPLPEES